jgi:hypothetical protein
MSADKLVFDLAQEIEGSPSVFVKKDWLNILDNQNQNYASNQSVLDTSQLANSNKYMSYREAYLAVPMLLTMLGGAGADAGAFTPATSGTSADYCMGLKNWFGQIIHSFTLDLNGVTVVQQTPYINMWNSFKLMTSLSLGDIETQGAQIGFYPDDPCAFGINYSVAAGDVGGQGISNTFNNCISVNNQQNLATSFNTFEYARGNIGFLKRQTYINYDPAGNPSGVAPANALNLYSSLLTGVSCNQVWKSYISNKVDGVNNGQRGVFQISVLATIYLKHIHSFFSMTPLLKGVFCKMTMNLNNTTTGLQIVGGTSIACTSVSNPLGGVNPLMVASVGANQGALSLGTIATGYQMNVSVGAVCLNGPMATTAGVNQGTLARSIYLYIPAYTFNPVFEQAYLSSPIKTIKYTDVYQYQVIGIGANQNFNNLLTNGIANIKSVLLIPFFSATTSPVGGINPSTGLIAGLPVFQSPFDPAGTGCTSPLVQLSNFNIVVSGQNAIYNQQRYSFEAWNNQLYGKNAVNGGMTDGLTSGLIDKLGFEMEYCYYYVDVSRMLPVEESVPKSVQIIGQNFSGKAIDLWCMIEYGVDISVDILTGARV